MGVEVGEIVTRATADISDFESKMRRHDRQIEQSDEKAKRKGRSSFVPAFLGGAIGGAAGTIVGGLMGGDSPLGNIAEMLTNVFAAALLPLVSELLPLLMDFSNAIGPVITDLAPAVADLVAGASSLLNLLAPATKGTARTAADIVHKGAAQLAGETPREGFDWGTALSGLLGAGAGGYLGRKLGKGAGRGALAGAGAGILLDTFSKPDLHATDVAAAAVGGAMAGSVAGPWGAAAGAAGAAGGAGFGLWWQEGMRRGNLNWLEDEAMRTVNGVGKFTSAAWNYATGGITRALGFG